ncbi:MAG: 3-oxoacyl-ACP reductase [Acidobacteria bacterium]|nr:MAG: 3-oxoacyl-ACP reductase [Acidobacteriota bacterium]
MKMDLGIQGQTALVAASSKGIGRACALCLAKEGCNVICCSRTLDEVMQTAESIQRQTGQRVMAFKADLTLPEEIDELIEKSREALGSIDILVNNCGGPPPGQFMSLEDENWELAYQTTLMSTVRLTKRVLPDMQAAKWGRIINITSVSVRQPVDGLMLSTAFRAGVVGMSKTLANEIGEEGITINTVAPGYIFTKRLEYLFDSMAHQRGVSSDVLMDEVKTRIPMARFASPEEVASAVTFLASKQASYITGTILPVDGGFIRSI